MQVGAAAATTHVAVIAYDVTARRCAARRGTDSRGSSYRSAQCDDATHTHTCRTPPRADGIFSPPTAKPLLLRVAILSAVCAVRHFCPLVNPSFRRLLHSCV